MFNYSFLRREIETDNVKNYPTLLISMGLRQLSEDVDIPYETLKQYVDTPWEFTAGDVLKLGRLLEMNSGALAEKLFVRR